MSQVYIVFTVCINSRWSLDKKGMDVMFPLFTHVKKLSLSIILKHCILEIKCSALILSFHWSINRKEQRLQRYRTLLLYLWNLQFCTKMTISFLKKKMSLLLKNRIKFFARKAILDKSIKYFKSTLPKFQVDCIEVPLRDPGKDVYYIWLLCTSISLWVSEMNYF